MARLYELSQEYRNLMDLLEEEDENQELYAHTLEIIDEEIEDKAESIAKVIKEIEGEIEISKAEEKRLATRRKTKENKIQFLKMYLENEMRVTGKTKFKTNLFSFGIQKNPPSLNIEREDNIPEEYFKVVKNLDKKELLKDIKEGLVVDGVSVKQSESLRIR